MTKEEIAQQLEALGHKVDRRRSVDTLVSELNAARQAAGVQAPGAAHAPVVGVEDPPRQLPTPALRGGPNWSQRVRAKQAERRRKAGLG